MSIGYVFEFRDLKERCIDNVREKTIPISPRLSIFVEECFWCVRGSEAVFARFGHERGGSANLRCRKVNSHGLADSARLQEAQVRWLGELAVQESKLARVSRPDKVARGTSEVARRTCGAGK
ncbi:hypothetical protein CRG98_005063 [Punica granatum]|uniref:Uncharacterized protein n=1 Tax=Punica granatum TaxID=22663 RepID=A0A2I0L1D8_PUNGR|nr:hypothetical protein CRG98_005063 [Punica granatum]